MRFNYFREAKEKGHSRLAFEYAVILKDDYGDSRYMAAHWLAWAYTFLRKGEKRYARLNLRAFLQEVARICEQ